MLKENFEAMHEDICARTVDSGVANGVAHPVWVIKEGIVVQTNDETWGRQGN